MMMRKTVIVVRFCMAIAVLCFGCYLVWSTSRPFDDTDTPPHRSGLTVYTDAKTGCEYVSIGRGTLAPRIVGFDRHAGCRN